MWTQNRPKQINFGSKTHQPVPIDIPNQNITTRNLIPTQTKRMATSSIANIFSFFTPSKPPPAPPLKFPPSHLSTAASPSPTNVRSVWAPLATSNEAQPSDVMSLEWCAPRSPTRTLCSSDRRTMYRLSWTITSRMRGCSDGSGER